MTISLYTVAEGADYGPFVARWWESVQRMDPMPNEIVIVIGSEDRAGVRKVIGREDRVKVVQLDEPFSNRYFSTGAEACSSEWVGFCGIDDVMLPRGYSQVPAANERGADIMVGTIILSNGATWRGSWAPQALRRYNTLPAHSPFRKSVYERVGGFPDIHWSDWGFWLRCARAGVTVAHSLEPIAIFDIGEGRETMSGVGLSESKRRAADAELQEFLRNL